MEALKSQGHRIIECRDTSPGIKKFFKLWQKHREIAGTYDVLIVGYPGHLVVPFARLISSKKVIADALGSLFDAEVYSHYPTLWKKIKSYVADWLMVLCAHKIMLETHEQKKFFVKKFGQSDKYEVVYTGVNVTYPKRSSLHVDDKKVEVLFRGKLTPESGVMHILKAAELLKDENHIHFTVIGSGYFLEDATSYIKKHNLVHVDVITQFLSEDELFSYIRGSDMMLGQFEDSPRLNRTIPHKAFEAFACGIPYLTGNAPAIKEIVVDNQTAFLVPLSDPYALAEKIKTLSQKMDVLQRVGENGYNMYVDKFSGAMLGKRIEQIIQSIL